MKKTPRKKLVAQLDKLWSEVIRLNHPACIVCGKTSNLNAHHAIVRKAQSLGVRWLLLNGVSLCISCHLFKLHGQQGDHQFLETYMAKLDELIPADEQLNIKQIGHQVTKYSLQDLEEKVLEFKKILGGK